MFLAFKNEILNKSLYFLFYKRDCKRNFKCNLPFKDSQRNPLIKPMTEKNVGHIPNNLLKRF